MPMTPGAMVATWIVALFAVLGGAFITLATDDHFTSPGYALVRGVPGGMDTWGDVLAAFGIVLAVGLIRRQWVVKTVGLVGVSLWALVFGVTAILTYAQVPNAGPTAPPIYLGFGLLVMCLVSYEDAR